MGENQVKLNLGSGAAKIPGYYNLDISDGQDVFKALEYGDGTVDEVRASHILEHAPHHRTVDIVREWARVLKPGGRLKVAVPNFEWCVDEFHKQEHGDESDAPIEAYLMGGQVDEHDQHLALFTEPKLRQLLHSAGLERIAAWSDDVGDSASLPVSLNLQGTKPAVGKAPCGLAPLKVAAVMSTPRLGFMDNFTASWNALVPLKIPLKKYTGAFWEQCLTRCIDITFGEIPDVDAILTLDYDTLFTLQDVIDLIKLMAAEPDMDAVCALQVSRTEKRPLLTLLPEDREPWKHVHDQGQPHEAQWLRKFFEPAASRIHTGHFGLTLIRASKLKALPKPWFHAKPNEAGDWGENRTDADISFWYHWHDAGFSLYSANHVTIGHAELMVRWPNVNLGVLYQHPNEFFADGKPPGAWR